MELSPRERCLAAIGLALVCDVYGLILLSSSFASTSAAKLAVITGVILAALTLFCTLYVVRQIRSGLRWLLIPCGLPLAWLAIDALFRRMLHWL